MRSVPVAIPVFGCWSCAQSDRPPTAWRCRENPGLRHVPLAARRSGYINHATARKGRHSFRTCRVCWRMSALGGEADFDTDVMPRPSAPRPWGVPRSHLISANPNRANSIISAATVFVPKNRWILYVAVPRGLEPPTFGLGNRCSIRLSYGTAKRNVVRALGYHIPFPQHSFI